MGDNPATAIVRCYRAREEQKVLRKLENGNRNDTRRERQPRAAPRILSSLEGPIFSRVTPVSRILHGRNDTTTRQPSFTFSFRFKSRHSIACRCRFVVRNVSPFSFVAVPRGPKRHGPTSQRPILTALEIRALPKVKVNVKEVMLYC